MPRWKGRSVEITSRALPHVLISPDCVLLTLDIGRLDKQERLRAQVAVDIQEVFHCETIVVLDECQPRTGWQKGDVICTYPPGTLLLIIFTNKYYICEKQRRHQCHHQSRHISSLLLGYAFTNKGQERVVIRTFQLIAYLSICCRCLSPFPLNICHYSQKNKIGVASCQIYGMYLIQNLYKLTREARLKKYAK